MTTYEYRKKCLMIDCITMTPRHCGFAGTGAHGTVPATMIGKPTDYFCRAFS
jgi:hypothetical protein